MKDWPNKETRQRLKAQATKVINEIYQESLKHLEENIDNYMKPKKLIWAEGEGYSSCPENGEYSVKWQDKEKEFTSLSEARKYFDSLNEPKALWHSIRGDMLEMWEWEDDDINSHSVDLPF